MLRPHLFVHVLGLQTKTQTIKPCHQVKLWTLQTEGILQDCFTLTDWNVVKAEATLEDSSVSIQDYAEKVTGT